MNRIKLTILLAILSLVLCACTTHSNPLIKAEATAVPGLSMNLHAASASGTNTDNFIATLYFRYQDQPMLAKESRMLSVKQDESNEFALLNALLEGPSAGNMDLRRLFPESIKIESVSSRDNVLFVTFNNALLDGNDLPDNWQELAEWSKEAPLLRKLQIQSVVASITECFPYKSVQIMTSSSDTNESLRLDNRYFLTELSGLSDPFLRDEALLLTPQNTANRILSAWQEHTFETLYAYTTTLHNASPRPTLDAFIQAIDKYPSVSDFTCSGGSVSIDGARAVISASFSLHQNGESRDIADYPIHLSRENGIWKIAYPSLVALMSIQ